MASVRSVTGYDLAAMTLRAKPSIRRKAIVLRDIAPPAMLATNLYLALYKPIVGLWQRRGERIAAEYARTIAAITTDAPADLQAELDAAASEFDRLLILLRAGLEQWAVTTERWARGKWRGAVLSATGIDLTTLLGPEATRETVQSYVEWNVALAKDLSAQAQQRIGQAVFAGVQNRTPAREVAKSITEAVGMSKKRALGIAADQTSKLTSALADERRREAGLDVWQWRHSFKRHPREWHKARDGHLYSDDPARVGTEVDGKTVEEPPARDDLPGRPPWCGCRSQAVLIFA